MFDPRPAVFTDQWQPLQPPQLPLQPLSPQPPQPPCLWECHAAQPTPPNTIAPTMMVGRLKFVARNSIIQNTPFQTGQMILLDLGNVDLDLVVANVLVGAEHQVQERGKNHDCHDGEEVEANLTGDQAAQLVHHQSGAVSQSAHITNGDGGPLAVVHLALDGAHSSEAGSAQQVEDHEAVSGDRGEAGSNLGPDFVAVVRQLVSIVIQNTEGTDDILLGDQAGDGRDGCTPVAEAQRSEDPGDLGSDSGQDGVVLILDHAEGTILETEALQEPQHDGRQQNDGTGTLDEGPAALPGCTEHVAPCRHMVSGQLHDEGSGVACEDLGLFQDDAGADDGSHADEVSRNSHQRRAAEHGTCDEADDGHLSAAGDEAGGHDGHAAVALVLDGTGSHNTGHAAAGTDQHGDEALTGQAELAEDTVHDEGDTGHIADVLQDGQQEEQDQHLRHEAQNCADTGDDAVHDQAVQPACHADALQKTAQSIGNDFTEQDIVGPVGGKGTNGPAAVCNGGAHGQGVHQEHDQREDGQSQHTVGHDLVDLIGNGQVLHAGLLLDCLAHHGVDVGVALVGDDALGVIVHLSLAVLDVLVDVVDQALVELQLVHDLLVALEQLDGVPAQEAVIHFALNGLFDVGNGVLHAAGEHMGQLSSLGSLCSSHSSLFTRCLHRCSRFLQDLRMVLQLLRLYSVYLQLPVV